MRRMVIDSSPVLVRRSVSLNGSQMATLSVYPATSAISTSRLGPPLNVRNPTHPRIAMTIAAAMSLDGVIRGR
jgi:hypothetical protein